MLINFSNHPLSVWSEKQIKIAKEQYGDIVDIPFPNVEPDKGEQYIRELVDEYIEKVKPFKYGQSTAVHIMGEMNFVYGMVTKLKNIGFVCIASTTERVVNAGADGVKVSSFQFVRFRKYE